MRASAVIRRTGLFSVTGVRRRVAQKHKICIRSGEDRHPRATLQCERAVRTMAGHPLTGVASSAEETTRAVSAGSTVESRPWGPSELNSAAADAKNANSNADGPTNISMDNRSNTDSVVNNSTHQSVNHSSEHAQVLGTDAASLRLAGARLRSGGLVAFPTETVYGLGANALDAAAVHKIFAFKGRPLTDPLIVHVPAAEQARALLRLDAEAERAFFCLASAFWPGPLTLVAPAHPSLPPAVSAGTGFVGLRVPEFPVALRLLREAAVPVAAPSANRFGHVSPTCAQHVLDDLGAFPIAVVDADREGERHGERERQSSACTSSSSSSSSPPPPPSPYPVSASSASASSSRACRVGIESTVAKIDGATHQIVLFRRGGVSQAAIERALAKAGLNRFVVRAVDQLAKMDDAQKQVAPGQLITHYAPEGMQTFIAKRPSGVCGQERPGSSSSSSLASSSSSSTSSSSPSSPHVYTTTTATTADGSEPCTKTLSLSPSFLQRTVVVDFAGQLSHLSEFSAGYVDLSPAGDVSAAAAKLFESLRWTETLGPIQKQGETMQMKEVDGVAETPETPKKQDKGSTNKVYSNTVHTDKAYTNKAPTGGAETLDITQKEAGNSTTEAVDVAMEEKHRDGHTEKQGEREGTYRGCAETVLLADVRETAAESEHTAALFDRMFRAASGKVVELRLAEEGLEGREFVKIGEGEETEHHRQNEGLVQEAA